MSQHWDLGQFLSSEEHGEWIAAIVWSDDLLNLNGVVTKEEVKTIVFIATVVSSVPPQNSKRKNLAVIVKERFKGIGIWSATLKANFEVVLVLGKIWRVLLKVDHSTGSQEGIIGERLRCIKSNAFVGVETSSEVIAIIDAEDSAIEFDILGDSQVLPGVGVNRVDLWNQMSLKENSLRNS